MPEMMRTREILERKAKPFSRFTEDGFSESATALYALLADSYALYIKTKSFHWHMSGPHFRDYHLLLDEQADELLAMTDAVAERSRKIGASTIRSISDISRHQRLQDSDAITVNSREMLVELCLDNQQFSGFLRNAHAVCDRNGDVATAGLIENWIDQAERRSWFLYETVKDRLF